MDNETKLILNVIARALVRIAQVESHKMALTMFPCPSTASAEAVSDAVDAVCTDLADGDGMERALDRLDEIEATS